MTTLNVSVTTKEVPLPAGTVFIPGQDWVVNIKNSDNNVVASWVGGSPTVPPFDVTSFADGTYTLSVYRQTNQGTALGLASQSFTINNTMLVPDVITLTLS